MIVKTASGQVRGRVADGIAVFRGLPYAKAPFGELRFRAPEPAAPWKGVRDALEFGPTAPKRPYPAPLDRLLADPSVPGDDCLNLNVWTPEGARDLPVMVWIHGGSLRYGSSVPAVYDGTAFARDGVVLVSINYRLGIEGFGLFPDAPENLGLLDQIAALRWVQANIGAFGGDPGNVTVFGESAGAISVAALLNRNDGLFRRAIMQSGPPATIKPAEARRLTRKIARKLGVSATAAAFADVDREKLLDAQVAVRDGFGIVESAGSSAPVDLMVGYNSEEYRLWFVPGGLIDRIGPVKFRLALLNQRISGRIARLYRANRPGAKLGEVLGMLATDYVLRIPINHLADDHSSGGTFMYEFAWRSPVEDLGACHGLEIGFVFDTLNSPNSIALAGPEAPQELADTMHAAWVTFAKTGNPGWPSWNSKRPVMRFARTSEVIHAPREDERAIWVK